MGRSRSITTRGGERGAHRITVAFFSLILGVIGFCAYHIVPFYYYYFEFTNQLAALASTAERSNDAAIRKRVMGVVRELEIPIAEGDIQIDRRDGMIAITVPYTEVFYVTFRGKDYDIYAFNFRASGQGAL